MRKHAQRVTGFVDEARSPEIELDVMDLFGGACRIEIVRVEERRGVRVRAAEARVG